jgi:hypothetical protein
VGRARGGGRRREGNKQRRILFNQILEKNKSTMLDDLGYNGIKKQIRNAHTLP